MVIDGLEQIAGLNARTIAGTMGQHFLRNQPAGSLCPKNLVCRNLKLALVAIVDGCQNHCGNRQYCQYDSSDSEWDVPWHFEACLSASECQG